MFAPPYRAAVIGRTGRGGYGHNLDLAVMDQAKLHLTAVADDAPEGRAAAMKRLRVENAYDDYRVMLEREKPQFVVVAPRWLDGHEDMILACAEHGVLGVFCEKPMAGDLAACDAIVDACDRSHLKLAMAYQTRYRPRYQRMKALIAEGVIGEVLEIRMRGKEDRRGGGEDLMVLGVHLFDVCRDLLGDPSWCFARVTEQGRPIGPNDVRDGAEGIGPLAGDRIDAMYGFRDSPAVAHFASSRPTPPGARFGLTICGSKGCLWTEVGATSPAYLLADPRWNAVGDSSAWTPIDGDPDEIGQRADAALAAANRAIVEDLILAVETDVQPRADVRSGRAAIEMALACYASQRKGGPVEMPLMDRKDHPLSKWTEN